ncbi:class I SAM-dependent methyltransferase [Abyssicoccus albus]|uniref:Methyltransferase family protein n=1 Tax=Abyssicoccus albus TaxID=1817405 RepID=A0A3N5CA30_9BACL|nr:class I SAM-dependent methyltransferase [Abyssicoccus albus]RPF56542.1 methyltransferase family protein [Abyssicoccus albus]
MNHWDERFKVSEYIYGEAPNEFVKSHFNQGSGRVALFAEGEGRNAVYLASLGYSPIAYDYSKEGLKKARALAMKHNVEIDTLEIDLTQELAVEYEAHDNAVMIFGHVHKQHQQQLFNNLIDCVKPFGRIYFEVYAEGQLDYGTGGPKDREMLYSLEDIKQWVKEWPIDVVELSEEVVERYEGDKHYGESLVIQGVLQKRSN